MFEYWVLKIAEGVTLICLATVGVIHAIRYVKYVWSKK